MKKMSRWERAQKRGQFVTWATSEWDQLLPAVRRGDPEAMGRAQSFGVLIKATRGAAAQLAVDPNDGDRFERFMASGLKACEDIERWVHAVGLTLDDVGLSERQSRA
jgi:hypothetical protein